MAGKRASAEDSHDKKRANSSDNEEEKGDGARKSNDRHEDKPGEDSKEDTEVFIGNLPFSAAEDQLKKFFSTYGDVASVKILQRVYFF